MVLKEWGRTLKKEEAAIERADKKCCTLIKEGKWKSLASHTEKTIAEALSSSQSGRNLVDAAIALRKLRNRAGSNGQRQADAGELASRCGLLLRRKLLSYAIAFRLRHFALTAEGSALARAEQKRAGEDPFESLSPEGELVEIGQLLEESEKYDGKLVRVDGEIRSLVTRVTRGKATSRFVLYDRAHRRRINGFVPWIQIDSGGIKNDSYVTIVGTWHSYDRESRQKHTIHIDRIAFTKQASKSWLDYQTTLARSICDYLPHGLNLAWSWETGSRGVAALLQHTHLWGGNEAL